MYGCGLDAPGAEAAAQRFPELRNLQKLILGSNLGILAEGKDAIRVATSADVKRNCQEKKKHINVIF